MHFFCWKNLIIFKQNAFMKHPLMCYRSLFLIFPLFKLFVCQSWKQSCPHNEAKHCKVRKRCAANYDPHCFRQEDVLVFNQRSFWLFLLVQNIIVIQYDYQEKNKRDIDKNMELYCDILIMFLFLMLARGMPRFHTYLIIVGVTTYELLKKYQYKKASTNSQFNIRKHKIDIFSCWLIAFKLRNCLTNSLYIINFLQTFQDKNQLTLLNIEDVVSLEITQLHLMKFSLSKKQNKNFTQLNQLCRNYPL
ncbi:unnamed protein product [Paramecium octaurelia]|uniref:Palmitoyltransferase n=1 Tax=Paramecium octaurelia TaxID=43137 RepID=A0A8S1TLI0_PAROT|nr:unnamed protein product [Paramecium octaurelia]